MIFFKRPDSFLDFCFYKIFVWISLTGITNPSSFVFRFCSVHLSCFPFTQFWSSSSFPRSNLFSHFLAFVFLLFLLSPKRQDGFSANRTNFPTEAFSERDPFAEFVVATCSSIFHHQFRSWPPMFKKWVTMRQNSNWLNNNNSLDDIRVKLNQYRGGLSSPVQHA